MSYWGFEPHTPRLQNGCFTYSAYTTKILLILIPREGLEPSSNAYEAYVLTD